MEGAPKFTPRSEGPEKLSNTQVEELAIVAGALEADMAKRGAVVDPAPESIEEDSLPHYTGEGVDIDHFEPGEGMLSAEGQRELRETLSAMQLIPNDDHAS